MNYEKKYKEAQGWIEKIYPTLQHEQQMEAEAFFPELAESEDERIRKELIVWLKNSEGQTLPIDRYNAALAWLERQGEQKPQRMISAEAKEAMYAKPAWSEEDEVKINRIVDCLENLNVADNDILLKDVDWLKSLKTRVQPKQDWSEEDEILLKLSLENLTELKDRFGEYYGRVGGCIDWLKSLRPRKQ